MHISSVAGLYSAGMTCPHATKTLLVLPPLSSCLIKLTLDITHSMVRDNVWFRINSIESLCVLFLCCGFGLNNFICKLLYSIALLLGVVNCILLVSVSVLA